MSSNRFIYILVTVAVLLSCTPPGNNDQQDKLSTIEKTDITPDSVILHYEEKLIDAYKANKFDVLGTLYHDNLVFNSPDGRTLTKAEDIESLRSGVLKIIDYTPSQYSIKITGNVATVSVMIRIKAVVSGNAFEGDFRFLRVWKKIGDGWKVIAISGCPVQK